MGVLGNYAYQHASYQVQHSWGLGPYGDFGATWFFTPHLSLGALGRLSATWGRSHVTFLGTDATGQAFSEETRGSAASYSFSLARLTAAVYF